MKIEIEQNSIIINGNTLIFPFKLEELISIIGNYSFTEKITYYWDDLGFSCTVLEDNIVSGLYITFADNSLIQHPINTYSGEYFIDGKPHNEIKYFDKKKFGNLEVLNSDSANNIIAHSLIQPVIPEPEVENPDLYKLKEFDGEFIQFEDFNFKLAVIEFLMYSKRLIEPIFYLDEFVKRHKNRKINTWAEGENNIQEAEEYFKQLKIDKNLVHHVTELFQDDACSIYYQITPFGNIEDGRFDIKSSKDIKHFPNLKRITLFANENPELKKELENIGVEVQYS
ncbi:DUF6892 domain-containing protein [Aquimarina sp. 2304DJ70-9]|uniref:DUF6892 domain-containing protein n=1 Tax=Aquimarina penaris TaxID=3231044 RepID=UPI0034631E25